MTDPLLERIWANPADDDARRVYADQLEERGDPRGPFISLQLKSRAGLDDAERAREFALLSEHGTSWLDPLGPLMLAPVFERGFLAECTLLSVPAWAVGAPLWATVERLHYSGPDDERLAELVMHDSMRALDVLSEPGVNALGALAKHQGSGGPRKLVLNRRLHASEYFPLGHWRSPRLTQLRLGAGSDGDWSDLIALRLMPLGRRLTAIEAERRGLELRVLRGERPNSTVEARVLVRDGIAELSSLVSLWQAEGLSCIRLARNPALAADLEALTPRLASFAESVEWIDW